MKILVLAPQPFFQNRGTPIAVRLLAEELQGAGHAVELLTFHEGENVDLKGVVHHRIPSLPGLANIGPGFSLKKIISDFILLLVSIRLCFRNKYTIVHAVEESVFVAIILKVIFRTPYIYDVDSWMSDQLIDKYPVLRYLRRLFSFFEKSAVKYSNGVVAVCKALEQKVRAIDDSKLILRLEDVSLLDPLCQADELITDLVGRNKKIVLYVGNLESYQGIDLLLQSFALVAKDIQESCLVIIGGSQKDREKYASIAEDLAIGSRVFLIGPRPLEKLGGFLRQADLLVSPRTDGGNTPMKIYSYMASGVAIAATKIESHTQVLDNTNAILAEPVTEKYAEALILGLSEKEYASKLAGEAQKLVESEYSRAAFRKKITDFYIELSNVWNLRF